MGVSRKRKCSSVHPLKIRHWSSNGVSPNQGKVSWGILATLVDVRVAESFVKR